MDMNAFQMEELTIGQTFCHEGSAHLFPTEAEGDYWMIAQSLQEKYGNLYQSMNKYQIERDTDMQYGNLVAIPMWTKNIAQLQRLCDADATCLGFTTEGYLKKALDGKNKVKKQGVDLYIKH
jgi:hypothetical protein